jgi:tetratricopeptide (TPR) repeat protein
MYMVLKRVEICLALLAFCLLFAAGPAFSQNPAGSGSAGSGNASSQYAQRLQRGVGLYRESRFREAIDELRLAQVQAANANQNSEALYWLALAELSAADYESALRDMDALERSGGNRTLDISYHRGRAYYYLGYYDEAMALLYEYATKAGTEEKARISAAYYWVGECLLSLGQLDRAKDFFTVITEQYPDSVKYEASSYRLALISQKKVEAELLALIKWSHEESLKTIEEYQRRERTYDQALNAYQRQIAEHQRYSQLSEIENDNAEYRRQLNEANERIFALERLLESRSGVRQQEATPPGESEDEKLAWAMQLRRELEQNLKKMENTNGVEP